MKAYVACRLLPRETEAVCDSLIAQEKGINPKFQ